MKTLQLTIGILLAAVLTLPAVSVADEAAELETVRETVSSMFNGIEPEDIFKSEVDGWYTVRRGAIVAYISGDGRYLLQGDLIDLESQVNLSEKSRNDARVKMMSGISEDQMIIFAPENPRHTISVFTDIDCTYCRRLHSQIDEYMEHGIAVQYFLYPRSGPASPSWTKAEEVWCSSDQNNALTLAKLDQSFDTESCDASIIDTHYTMGQDVGLRGTPAIVLEDGTLFSGYLPPEQLSEAIVATLGE